MSRNFWHLSDIIWTPSQNKFVVWKADNRFLTSRPEARALHMQGSCLRHLAPSKNIPKRLFCSLSNVGVILICFGYAFPHKNWHKKYAPLCYWIKRKTKTNQTCLHYFPVLCVSLINMYLPSVLIVLLDCVMPGWRDFVGFGFTILSWKLLCLICFYTEVKVKVMWISRRWSSVSLCIFFFWCLRFLFALILVEGKFSHGGSCLCLCMYCRHCQSLHVSGDSDMTDL